jgi:hypothetical protein
MVKTKRLFGAVLVMAGLVLIVYGYGSYGNVRSQMDYGNRITVQGMVKDWQDYTIYFTGHGRGHPSAVLFEPKEGNRVIIPDRWWKVKKYEILTDLVDSIQRQLPIGYYYPRLLELLARTTTDMDVYLPRGITWSRRLLVIAPWSSMICHCLPILRLVEG